MEPRAQEKQVVGSRRCRCHSAVYGLRYHFVAAATSQMTTMSVCRLISTAARARPPRAEEAEQGGGSRLRPREIVMDRPPDPPDEDGVLVLRVEAEVAAV